MRAVILLIVVAGHALTELAAQETTGDLRGRVVTVDKRGLAGAEVIATGPNLQGSRTSVSKEDGVFLLLSLPPGEYTLRIRAIGFRPLAVEKAVVLLGRTSGLGDLHLELAPVELGELTVTAPRVVLDPVRTTVGATLRADDYDALPAERDYKSLLAILPHVNTSYHGDPVNVGGSSGLENMFFVDGVNVTAPLKANASTSLPYNFVRTVEVKAGGYEAQYGRALGAVVNAVTYSGTNEFESSVFAFFTNSLLAASPRAQPAVKETSAYSYDVGGRISGPVLRDRLWFSAAYNFRIDHAEREIQGLGNYPDDRRANIFAGKLTYQAGTSTTVEVSVFGDPTTQHEVASIPFVTGLTPANPDPYLHYLEIGGFTLSGRASTVLGPVLLEAMASRSTSDDNILAETDRGKTEPYLEDYVAGVEEGGVPYPQIASNARTSGVLRGRLTSGRHSAVLGFEYEDVRSFREGSSVGGGTIRRIIPEEFVVDSQAATGTFRNVVPTAYLQDTWRPTDRLTINAGLRWSRQRFTFASGSTAQQLSHEWQPRLGFSWQFGRPGSQRVFGSYGRFYQQAPLNLASLWYVDYYYKVKSYSSDPRQPGVLPDWTADYTTYESQVSANLPNVSSERFDEFTAGYERLLGQGTKLTIRGIYRNLGTTFQQGVNPSEAQFFFLGTPGRGDLSFLPTARREYSGLELGVEGSAWNKLQYLASYVLSRTWGNFTGLYSSDIYFANPGIDYGLMYPHQAANSTGLLPNDRAHVLKLTARYRASSSVSAGTFFTWQSGTPLNEFGVGPNESTLTPAFVSPRGSVGRTPPIWDLNLRVSYDTRWPRNSGTRVLLDMLHVGNPRTTVRMDQVHFRTLSLLGNQAAPNPDYLLPIAFQPPMAARLGIEVRF